MPSIQKQQVRDSERTVPDGLVLIPSGMETDLAEAIIKDIICNRWE